MKNINNLGYFERQTLIDRIGRKIIEAQGWKVEREGDIQNSENPRLQKGASIALEVLEEIETYLEETVKRRD